MNDITREIAYVRKEEEPILPAPRQHSNAVGWIARNLFSSVTNTVLTLLSIALVVAIVPPLFRWAFLDAAWTGSGREVCIAPGTGACWAFVRAKFGQFMYGHYPLDQRWRVDLTAILLIAGIVPMAIPRVPWKRETAIYLFAIFPVIGLVLLTGGHFRIPWIAAWIVIGAGALASAIVRVRVAPAVRARAISLIGSVVVPLALLIFVLRTDFGLVWVETADWGGLLVTLVVAIVGMVASLPLGILLALGRRSRLPVIRSVCVVFIEFVRGVPLITVLFMASVMLPLFLPQGVNFDKLLRALIGVALFSAAYMAEVVRGGLQAMPRGQYEAASAIGLSYWQTMRLIILPQALKIVIPGIVNSFISLFKDTSLVLIIGIFDLLGIVSQNFTDSNWAAPNIPATGYAFAALVFWIFCFSMSRYSIYTERRLGTGYRR